MERAIQEARHAQLEGRIEDVRTLGDAVLATFFGAAKPRPREQARLALEGAAAGSPSGPGPRCAPVPPSCAHGPHPLRPFHWEAEFPEVFGVDPKADPERAANPGFDAIVGNPPFAGKNTLINGNRAHYLEWLQTLHPGAHGNADLVAHFVRRAYRAAAPGRVLRPDRDQHRGPGRHARERAAAR